MGSGNVEGGREGQRLGCEVYKQIYLNEKVFSKDISCSFAAMNLPLCICFQNIY